MRHWKLLSPAILLCFSSNLFAIACPGTAKNLILGQSIEQTIAICGQPIAQNHYKQATISAEEWTYYKKSHHFNEKMTLTFKNGQLVNIFLESPNPTCATNRSCDDIRRNVRSSHFCGRTIKTGYSSSRIQAICKSPANKNITNSVESTISKLKYKGVAKNTLVFKNNQLIDWTFE